MKIFTSNRLEVLLDQLIKILEQPLAPLESEIIVVQSRGMEHWLTMQLSARLDIWANCNFPFPKKMLQQVFRQHSSNSPNTSAYEAECMTWTIMRLLPNIIAKHQDKFQELNDYLSNDEQKVKLYQLSSKIAQLFDLYILFRPEMIKDWENNNEKLEWQTILWQEIFANYQKINHIHRAQLHENFINNLTENIKSNTQRITIFGISALPPFYIELISKLSEYVEINLFVLNPCQEYWFDIHSNPEIARKIRKLNKNKSINTDEQHFEVGNPLLASMGKLGRDLFENLLNYENAVEISHYENNNSKTILHCVQNDILNLEETISQDLNDNSIQIHNCHSPLREIEVLYDNLLNLFSQHDDLTPEDILVMTTDIEAYVPFIEAVFKKIPFSIADRKIREENSLIDTFLHIFNIKNLRLTITEVLTILESTAVQQKFNIYDKDIELIKNWLEQAGVRWGINAQQRSELGLPEFNEHTWKFGLDRLLLGYALPQNKDIPSFAGIAPIDLVEGNSSELLGKLLDFSEKLFAIHKKLNQSYNIETWYKIINEILVDFFDENAYKFNLDELSIVQDLLNKLRNNTKLAEFNDLISYEIIQKWLIQSLNDIDLNKGFITGGITFARMLPMRSIPFKIICLLGMNDRIYPRSNKPLSFDLIAQKPRSGDRSRRNDDRYLFLETIISARDYLYISYTGQNIKDNTEISPSVLVSELLDYIKQDSKDFIIKHPLQPFSPQYFKQNDKLFSYSQDYYNISQSLQTKRVNNKEFILTSLPKMEREAITLEQLINFYKNPSKAFLQKRLNIKLKANYRTLAETEPLVMDGLEKYNLSQDLLVIKEEQEIDYFSSFTAAGLLPHGNIGKHEYEVLITDVLAFQQKIKPYISEPLELLEYRQAGELFGDLTKLYKEGLIHYRLVKETKAKDLIGLWIEHLALNAIDGKHNKNSLFISKDKETKLKPLDKKQCCDILQVLLDYYWLGLEKPLAFFPETSFTYVKNKNSFVKANKKWLGDDYNLAESNDLYYQQCFNSLSLEDSEFSELANQFWQPMFENEI
jgi:exodeoxyribonuclease V gamma subunit